MNTIHSPYNIQLLLWFHCRPAPFEIRETDLYKSTILEFLEMRVIERDERSGEDCFTTTPLGKAWVQALCNVPPPKMAFIDEAGRVLE